MMQPPYNMSCNHALKLAFDYHRFLDEKRNGHMPWIDLYVAGASLVCTLAMAADVFHGFRHRKLWFPSKYFTLNAASLTLIAVAMKLPVDLSTDLDRPVDEATKISSLGFLCIMMANFMPSFELMNTRDLLLNITALGIFVITIVVNLSIQVSIRMIDLLMHLIYTFFVLYLLTLLASSALMVPVSKKILHYKYRHMLKLAFPEEAQCTTEKLIYDVSKYWIMAETSNPLLVLACSPTCSASGAICFFVVFILLLGILRDSSVLATRQGFASNYKWSVYPIIAVQLIGMLAGTIAQFFRLFRAFSYNLSLNQKVCQTEKYWSQMLVDWKSSRVPLQIGGLQCQKAIHEFKNHIVNTIIRIQIFMVIISKITQLISIFLVVMFCNCWYYFTWLVRKLMASICATKCHEGSESEHHDSAMLDLSCYVLQLEDEVELANRTLTWISKAVHQLIKQAEKKQPKNLMKLLEKSTGFEGVVKFQNNQVPPLHSLQHLNSWSLVVATLTSIAMALRLTVTSGCLLSGINEGMQLVRLIEESQDPNKENLVNVRKAASYVWFQVECKSKSKDSFPF